MHKALWHTAQACMHDKSIVQLHNACMPGYAMMSEGCGFVDADNAAASRTNANQLHPSIIPQTWHDIKSISATIDLA